MRTQGNRWITTLIGTGALALAALTQAQTRNEMPAPEILVSGAAELTIPPTTARFSIEVRTSAATAAAASSANAQTSKSVMSGLQGASGVSGVAFSSKAAAGKRQEALAQAVANARRDAEAVARAGGGRLGALLLISTERAGIMPGAQLNEVVFAAAPREAAPSTEILPRMITVSASVTVRWQFVPEATR
jgi:uncharacterized protein YggE